ncbi:MAG: carboxynorspermidine decarboxylase, partial [Lachnospiraceae bacterium]|nr:carboxynorspermidine decarboxylase [Lachnospiraceae bacterium]
MVNYSVFDKIKTPAYVTDESKLIKNLEILKDVKEKAGCKILLAQKAFSMYSVYPLIEKYLDGTTASGLFEARLGKEEFKGEVHVFAPAFKDEDILELSKISDHIVFNSINQLKRHADRFRKEAGEGRKVSVGLRVNPEISTQESAIYDPCAEG